MKIDGTPFRTIWPGSDGASVVVIDQTRLPHVFETVTLRTMEDAARAILTMQVRGAPLIGATAAYGLALALRDDPTETGLANAIAHLARQRPTAINLRWALEEVRRHVVPLPDGSRFAAAFAKAGAIADDDVEACRNIGVHGLPLISAIAAQKPPGKPVNILTHCNAGWLACVDWGTATSPIYHAFDAGIPVHVWVDETRPRNQGAALTAYELGRHGVPHTIIADNAGGHLMQQGEVDLCIVGTDRVAANGDVANKIGTYLKALAADDNGVPFYVALPYSTIDWTVASGREIPIEERSADEVLVMQGRLPDGRVAAVEIAAPGSPAANPAFDVTPARLVTGLITERGIAPATRNGLLGLYPERRERGMSKPDKGKRKPKSARGGDGHLRKDIIATALAMSRSGLSPNRSGNVSARVEGGMLITPTGLAYEDIGPKDIVFVADDGTVPGKQKKPSSEWQFHLSAYGARSDMHAVVHTHSLHAVVLACAGKPIPAFHYMVAVAGGIDIPVVPYATFGSPELAAHVAAGLKERRACLMEHHGAIAMGTSLVSALELAHEVEVLAEQYVKLLTLGTPAVLPEAEMQIVLERFKSYGQNAQDDAQDGA